MIEWSINIYYNGEEEVHDLTSSTVEQINIRETSNIKFYVYIKRFEINDMGMPYVVISDIPIQLRCRDCSSDGEIHIFESIEPVDSHESCYFYNFFGESVISLCFENSSSPLYSHTVNILARQANAELANEMLNHITTKLDDAISICFSRSKVAVGFDDSRDFLFSKLNIIEDAVDYLSTSLPSFIREHKFNWKHNMEITEQGLPTGPDSVHWALHNLDRLTPASIDDGNLIYKNRVYRLDSLPKENITKEWDVYENQVLHTFLHNAIQFLIGIKEQYSAERKEFSNDLTDLEYVRFDHTIKKFTQKTLSHKSNQIDSLIMVVEQIKKVFTSHFPARIVAGIQPKITSYVARHSHYKKAYELIEKCYRAPSPQFEGDNILLGLKNLSIIYELSSLILLHESIEKCFGVKLTIQSYRRQTEHLPFGGEQAERPLGIINNYFKFESKLFFVELFYEPKIYPFSQNSSIGDLVDTSNSKSNSYGIHHACPDFVLKINSSQWKRPATIILDAKYKNALMINKYDINILTRKYLLNIHQVNLHGNLGVSPVTLLLILFPHAKNGKVVRTVASQHCLDGKYPLLPQASAILVKPTDVTLLDKSLLSFINVMNNEEALIV